MTLTLAPGAVSFITPRGQYVGASLTNNSLEAVRSRAGYREVFLLLPTGDKCALQVGNGKYVMAQDGGGKGLLTNSPHVTGWESFGILPQAGDRLAFRVSNGQYIGAMDGGGNELVADRWVVNTTPESWECFRLV